MAPSATWQHKIKRCLEEDEGDFLQVIKTLSPEEKDEALLSLIIDHFDAGHAHPGLTRINSILNEFRQVNQEIIAVRRRLALFHEVIPSPGDLVGPSGDGGGRNSGEDTKDNHVGHTEYVGRGSNPDEDSKNDVAVTYDQVAISQGSQRANDHVESSVPVACGANNLVKPSLSLVLPRPGIASSCRASGHVGSAAAVALLGNYFTGDGGGRNSNEGNKSDVFAECNGRVKRPRSRRWKNRARLSGYGGGGGYSVEDSRNDVAGGNGRVPWRGSSWANKPVGSSVIEYLPLVFASVGRNSDEASTSYAFPDNNRSRRANNLVRPAVTVILPPSRYFYADNVGGRNFGKCPESDVVSRSNHQATSPGSRPVNDHAELSGNGGGRTSNNESTERNIIAHGNRHVATPGPCWGNDGARPSGYDTGRNSNDEGTEKKVVGHGYLEVAPPVSDSLWGGDYGAWPSGYGGARNSADGVTERNVVSCGYLQDASQGSRLGDYGTGPSGYGGGRNSDDKDTEWMLSLGDDGSDSGWSIIHK